MKKKVLFILAIFLIGITNAQIDFMNYKPVYSQGEIPDVFLKTSASKVTEQKSTSNSVDLDFLLMSNYLTDEILTSGNILYGDPMTIYINKLADRILAEDPNLRSQLSFYTLKSNDANAFVTSRGVVFVTIGLLSRIENEAQLAFILCHEIQHFKLKHSIKQYKLGKKLTQSLSNSQDAEEKLKQFYKFSKKQETSADSKGFELFSTLGYSLIEAAKSLQILEYSYLSFTKYNLNYSDFEQKDFKIPEYLKNKVAAKYSTALVKKSPARNSLNLINNDEDEDENVKEDYSTHPAFDARYEYLQEQAEGNAENKTVNFIGEEDFRIMQRMARYEYLIRKMKFVDFAEGLYLTIGLEKLYGGSPFLSHIKTHCYYGMAKGALRQGKGADIPDFEAEKDTAKILFLSLFNAMNKKEFLAFCARNLWLLESDSGKRCADVFSSGMNNGNIKSRQLLKPTMDTAEGGKNQGSFLFVDISSEPRFQKFIKGLRLKNPTVTEVDEEESENEEETTKTKKKSKIKEDKSKTKFIGKGKVLIFEPLFVEYNNRSGVQRRVMNRQDRMQKQIEQITRSQAPKLKLDLIFLENKMDNKLTTEKLVAYSKMRDWITERLLNDTGAFCLYFADEAATVSKNTETKYLAWMSYGFSKEKLTPVVHPLDLLIPPLMILNVIAGNDEFETYVLVVDMETGSVVYSQTRTRVHRLTDDFMKGFIYESLRNVRKSIQ